MVSTTLTDAHGVGDSQHLSALTLDDEVPRTPRVGFAERLILNLVVTLDALADLHH